MQLILIIISILLVIRISEEAYLKTSIKCLHFSSFDNNFDLHSNEKNASTENLVAYSDKDKITFMLYTKENPSNGELIELNLNSISKSHFNPKHPTRIVIHGWMNNKDSSVNKVIRKAYLTRGIFNVIAVDWSSIATNVYSKAKEKVDVVGKKVAQLIDFLHECAGISTGTLYLIGHSLGAHVAGFAVFVKCDDRLSSVNQKISALKDWERVPLTNGTFVWIHRLQIEQYLNTAYSTIQDDGLSRIFFKLYTNLNPTVGQNLKTGNKYLISKSNFNPKHPTRIIIHGWVSHIDSPVNQLVRKAYLTRGAYNVICMDWNSIASRVNYIGVRYSLESVSHVLSRFILFLHQNAEMPLESVYLIGHSLGAHLAGFTGKLFEKNKINTIIGLDPAGPLFSFNQPNERLSFNDAEYVETIQTDITNLGFSGPIGHASFYPNNGKNQPGCWTEIFSCSHARAVNYFAESVQYVNNMFMPLKCWDIFNSTFLNKTCSKYIDTIRMGGDPSNQLKNIGIYFLPTYSKSPFAVGNLHKSI